jgi:uncharacterized protein (TIGR03083 family)
MDRLVAAERTAPAAAVFQRWRTARRAALAALRACPPKVRLRWATIPLTPRTLATTRLAEHWAHALDITDPLGITYPDTVRLWHVAWLAHRSLPYAFTIAGAQAAPVRCELLAPDGQTWYFGPADAPSLIAGPAGTSAASALAGYRPNDRTSPSPDRTVRRRCRSSATTPSDLSRHPRSCPAVFLPHSAGSSCGADRGKAGPDFPGSGSTVNRHTTPWIRRASAG